ncbi:MAG: putative flavoprotein [Deltaproteobacteria bacterium]|nr:putative flavoprotein [Deltaproteobacteria bacterium]
MRFAVLNGSPKGDVSVTMQYVRLIEKKYPSHEFLIHNISQRISKLEEDEGAFQEIIRSIASADGVLWAFPLYYFLVPSQYKRFIELLWERSSTGAFKEKYAAVFSTSIHFFDHIAHSYLNAVCDDLSMRFFGGFSADMYDLLKEKERERLLSFVSAFIEATQNKIPTLRNYPPLIPVSLQYSPSEPKGSLDTGGKRVLILHDVKDPQSNAGKMIDFLRKKLSGKPEIYNLFDVHIQGGCLGCLQCGYDNQCAYTGKDDFIEFFNTKVKTADILIFAGTVVDRYLSSRWKMFFDRSFFNTHTPSFAGKQIGFILSGPLAQLPHLRQFMEAYTEMQQANLAGVVTDECADSADLDEKLSALAHCLLDCASRDYVRPRTFLGVGAMKVFRDDIYGRLRFPFLADHNYYKEHGLYDFPQKHYRARVRNGILGLLARISSFRKEVYKKRMKGEMIKPLKDFIDQLP